MSGEKRIAMAELSKEAPKKGEAYLNAVETKMDELATKDGNKSSDK